MQLRTKQISDLLTTCVPITGSTLDVNLNGKILSNLLTPLLIGGTAVGSTLTYKTTTGIGTTDAHIFQVGDDGATEAMRILNSGNVGIGTITPLGILHLYKSAATTRMVMDGDAGQSKIITYRSGGLQRFGLYVNNTAESGSNVGSDFQIRAYNDAGTLLSTPLFIKRSTGDIGIGTTSPVSLLNISNTPVGGTTGGNPTFTFLDTRNLNAAGWLANTTPLGTIQAYTTDASTTPNPIGAITFVAAQISGSSPACDISFSAGSSGTFAERMRILNSGNVGIGTAAPLTKLQIETSSTSTTLGSDFAQFPILLKNTSATDNNFTNILFRNSGATAVASMGVQVTSHASSTADILFATKGATFSEKMRITSAGNVGIGTIAPTQKLHIVGTSGTTIKIVDGNQAVGRVLTCDATGVGSWAAASGGSGWSLTGNFSTLDATNFIGTSDNIPFNIRQNNLKAGRIDVVLAGNTFFGFQAGNLNSGNNFNTAIGQYAMRFNTSGQHNTAVGHLAMTNNTTGVHNTSVGVSALENNGTGSRNSSLGWQANRYQGNSDNTAFGYRAAGVGFSNTATQNTSMGSSALLNNEGNNNVAVGFQAASNISTGQSNTIIGTNTGLGITTGNSNTVLGANVSGLSAALSNNIILADGGGTTRLQFSNTGALSLTGPAITVVAPTSPNRTLTVTVGGTVYYLHAKTTND